MVGTRRLQVYGKEKPLLVAVVATYLDKTFYHHYHARRDGSLRVLREKTPSGSSLAQSVFFVQANDNTKSCWNHELEEHDGVAVGLIHVDAAMQSSRCDGAQQAVAFGRAAGRMFD